MSGSFEYGSAHCFKMVININLITTDGVGYYHEEGSSIREIKVGDVVNVLPGIKHWHGTSPNSKFRTMLLALKPKRAL